MKTAAYRCKLYLMADLPNAVITSIDSHGQFLTTLALATAGGVFAFSIQIVFHNAKKDENRIIIRYAWLLLLAIFLSLISVVFWYALKSSLVAAIPALYGLNWEGKSATVVIKENGFGFITLMAELQIVFFALALLVMFLALLLNFRLLRGQS